jgi:anti-sigma factor RsiW
MNCRECAEMLLEYLTGELDEARRAELRLHLERCPPCVVYVETYQITIEVTRQRKHCAELPEDVAQRLWEAIQKEIG